MYTYKRIIRSRTMIEIEYYQSIRKVGKYYGGRSVNRGLSREKQRKANQIRTTRKWEQIIDCNFSDGDFFVRFSAPFGTFFDEQGFLRYVNNWLRRVKRRSDKEGLTLRYIGFRECGKLGKNWHLHLVMQKEVAELAARCWGYRCGGVNFTPLWENRSFHSLAKYIRKDIAGSKRMMASRNLQRPEIVTEPAKRLEVRRLERGEAAAPPAPGYVLAEDEMSVVVSDVTGARWYFKYRKVFPNS